MDAASPACYVATDHGVTEVKDNSGTIGASGSRSSRCAARKRPRTAHSRRCRFCAPAEPGGAIREQGFYAKRQEGKPVVPYDPAIHGKQNPPANAPARAVETPETAGAVVEPDAQTGTPTSPTSARQADINADREALGKAGFSTADVRKWSELEAKANPNAVPDLEASRPWSDQETVNATAKLRELKAQIEELRASKADPETLVTLEDEFDNLTEAMYRSGTEQGRALASRRYTMDVDMSVDGLRARYKARAKKNGTPVDAKRLQELEQIADDYKRLQEQIDSGELVRARKRSKGPAKTKEELAEELSKMWDEFTAVDADGPVPLASGFTTERVVMIGKMAVKAVELGVATIDELVEAVAKQFRDRGLDAPDRATILNAWRTEREAGRRSVSDEVKAARAQRAKLEAEINAELDAPKKAEANAKKAAEAAENRARRAAERQQQVEANQKARAEEKARARAQREAADAEAKALREEQERILSERKAWDKRNRDRQREMERLNTRIAELEQSIEAGTGVGPKPRKLQKEDLDMQRLRNQMETLRKRAKVIWDSQQPRTTGQRMSDYITEGKLLNPVARVLDLASGIGTVINRALVDGNVAALTSALSKDARVGFALEPAKIQRVVQMARSSDMWRQWVAEGMYGTRGIGGKMAAATDIPARMFLYHISLDDMAFNIARRELGKASKQDITARAIELLNNPTDEMMETATAEMLAGTYNTRSSLTKGLTAAKRTVESSMRTVTPAGADAFTLVWDSLTRFSNVIGNVVKDRAMRTMNIGGVPVASVLAGGRMAVKTARKIPMSSAERRGLQMLFAKGATGTALMYLGYNYGRELGIVPQVMRNTDDDGTDPKAPFVEQDGVTGVLEQVGGIFSPFVYGATLREIEDADITENMKQSLRVRVQMDMMTSLPATGGLEKLGTVTSGQKSGPEFIGGQVASQIPAPVKIAAERIDATQTTGSVFGKAPARRAKVDKTTEDNLRWLRMIYTPSLRNIPGARGTLPEQRQKNVTR